MSAKTFILAVLKGGLKVILPVAAIAGGVSTFIYLKSNAPEPPKRIKKEVVFPIRTHVAHISSHQPNLRLYGEIKSGRKVELRALVAGKIIKTGADLRDGALVEKDDLLLSIDPFSYRGAVVDAAAKIAEAKARLKEIKAQIRAEEDSIRFSADQLRLSERDLARAQRLVKKGSATRQVTEQRELVVSQRRQTIEGKRANLDVLKAKSEQQVANLKSLGWKHEQAQRNEHDTKLKAPFSGYVNEVNANLGKLVNVNDRIAVLLDNKWMDVEFTLSDQQYGRIISGGQASGKKAVGMNALQGRPVKVIWNLGDKPFTYEAKIDRVGAQIFSDKGGVTVYARLENPQVPKPIRVGAFVEVEIPDRVYEKAVRLPQTSLYERSKIYVIGADNRLEERRIELLAIDGADVLVSGAVAEGDLVVTTRMSTIGGGLKVRNMGPVSGQEKPGQKGQPALGEEDGVAHRESRWKPTRGGRKNGEERPRKRKMKQERGSQGKGTEARSERG